MGYLVIARSDGGITVRSQVEADDDHQAHVDQWETRARVKARGWTALSSFYSETDPRPRDRLFRNAFVAADRAVSVDIEKARTIREGHIRTAKREIARELLERESLGDDVTAERAAVAAVPDAVSGDTEEALKAWPDALERRTVRRAS